MNMLTPITTETATKEITTRFGSASYNLEPGTASADRFVPNIPLSAEIVSFEGNPRVIVSQRHPFINAALLVSEALAPSDLVKFYKKFETIDPQGPNLQMVKDIFAGVAQVMNAPVLRASLRKVDAERPQNTGYGAHGSFDANCD